MMESVKKWAQWCTNQWAMIKEGGVWVVPRSGLTLTKTTEGFELSDVARPVNEAFANYQRKDFACIGEHYKEAGLSVTDPHGLLNAKDHPWRTQ